MRLFAGLYERVLAWAGRPRAAWWLAALGFAESTFFPVPADALLAPMVLARPAAWLRLAALLTAASVAGGVAGYLLGAWAFEQAAPWLLDDAGAELARAQELFKEWGAWIVLAAAFTPVPYKAFTLSAGFLAAPFAPFVLASVVGRGARFLLVAGLVRAGGAALEDWLRRRAEPLGWILTLALLGVLAWRLWG